MQDSWRAGGGVCAGCWRVGRMQRGGWARRALALGCWVGNGEIILGGWCLQV
jgi:hypothetical protein